MSIEERNKGIVESFDQLPIEEQNAMVQYLFEKVTADRNIEVSSNKERIKQLEKANMDLYNYFNTQYRDSFAQTM
jgi:hypothetical protein